MRDNVLIGDDHVELIDFDDAGHGWRMFDIATALVKNRREPHFDVIRSALISGYRKRRVLRDVAMATLPLFLLIRSLSYIGWAASRIDEPGTPERLARFSADAQELADDFLAAEDA